MPILFDANYFPCNFRSHNTISTWHVTEHTLILWPSRPGIFAAHLMSTTWDILVNNYLNYSWHRFFSFLLICWKARVWTTWIWDFPQFKIHTIIIWASSHWWMRGFFWLRLLDKWVRVGGFISIFSVIFLYVTKRKITD